MPWGSVRPRELVSKCETTSSPPLSKVPFPPGEIR
jgi:hypothetical protein